ncbi:MAG: hypothetical protein D6739_00445 [Nitrospirae bacterium]|nr:MAG: hypothetical protein D6739_00445 [Nitrospirota bacterium]
MKRRGRQRCWEGWAREPAFVTGRAEGPPPRPPRWRRGPGLFYPLALALALFLAYLWVRPAVAPEAPAPKAAAVSPEVRELLAIARRQRADDRLTSPPGDNALETLREVLRRDPDNAEARAELRAIARTYARWARIAAAKGARGRARRYVERGLRVDPTDAELHRLLRQLGGE